MMSDALTAIQDFFSRNTMLVLLDIADISLVAFLLYRVFILVKGTRAMQMAIGLALVFLFHQLARRFDLITVWTILDAVITYLVLIIVVIFQNDIRRALMRVGRQPLFRTSSARATHVYEEVIKAATALGQKRVGAIIVFERDASLDEFIEPGTELDAAVTKELLFSVFIPSFENPMHDGAVIIREGRVWQAGAFLPLTTATQLDRALGTRHRAAIGISEQTDAVVVVVSEERGAISLCFNGNIIRDLDASALREALVGLFRRRDDPAPVKDKDAEKADASPKKVSPSAEDSADSGPIIPARPVSIESAEETSS